MTRSTPPSMFFFLVLPYGVSAGFVSVTLPFVLTRAGFSVAASASIVAVGISANIWRFAWGPVADLTLTLRRWYLIGLLLCAATLLLVSLVPLAPKAAGPLTAMVFLSQVAATLVVLPVGGLMAHGVADEQKGMAAGWYQAGNLGGAGLGGGAGVWLAHHVSRAAAGGALAAAICLCALALFFVPDVHAASHETLGHRMRAIVTDFRGLSRWPMAVLVIVMISSPIGSGAAGNVWSAVAPDWHADPDTVALVTGALNGVATIAGAVIGGWICDRWGRWWSFYGAGAVMAIVTALMAAAPRNVATYDAGVLSYAVTTGWSFAAFSALVLYVTRRGAASTKYATLSSLGNIPTTYMTAFDGWAHDRFGAAGMLNAETLLGGAWVIIGMAGLAWVNRMGSRAYNRAL